MNLLHFIRLFFCLFCIATYVSCNKPTQDPSLTIKKIGSDQLMTLNFKEIQDSIQIKLSDFATDFQFIPLETRPECLLQYSWCLVTRNYILNHAGEAGILQFSREGKFIRKLVSYGKGPIEVERSFSEAVDEENQVFILSSSGKAGYFMSFDLNSGTYLKNIPNAIPSYTRNMLLSKNRDLLCVPNKKPETGQPSDLIYRQTLDGKLIGGIHGPPGNIIKKGSTLYQFENEFRFSQMDDDTLFTVGQDKLKPYLAYNYGEPNPIGIDKVGYKRTSVVFEAKNFIFMSLFKIIGYEKSGSGSSFQSSSRGSVTWFCLDKAKRKVFLMKDIYNDFIGAGIQSQNIQAQPDGTIVMSYQAVDLKEIAEKALADPKTPPDIRQRMAKINMEVKADDNPVLIVGKLKTK